METNSSLSRGVWLALPFVGATAALMGGCGEPPAVALPRAPTAASVAGPPPSRAAPTPSSAAGAALASGSAETSPSALPTASAAEAPAERFAGTRFPPPSFEPPFARSARPGDGQWVRLGDSAAGDRAATDPAVMYKAVVHPHKVSRFMTVTLVAIDLRHAAIHFSAGTDDPNIKALREPAGLVPPAHRSELLAVFNGGFLPRHGNWGMMIDGVALLPPRPEGCTVALTRDGTVRIGAWSSLDGEAAELAAYRQTPPCLLDGGALHPQLLAGSEREWGGRDPNRKTRRRSAIGIDASGRVVLYAEGREVGPQMLALGMKHAGAVAAAQLDINWSWVRFLLFGQPSPAAELQVTSTLVPKMVYSRTGYVSRAAQRDFFYVMRR